LPTSVCHPTLVEGPSQEVALNECRVTDQKKQDSRIAYLTEQLDNETAKLIYNRNICYIPDIILPDGVHTKHRWHKT
jgi:hypothetical protein